MANAFAFGDGCGIAIWFGTDVDFTNAFAVLIAVELEVLRFGRCG